MAMAAHLQVVFSRQVENLEILLTCILFSEFLRSCGLFCHSFLVAEAKVVSIIVFEAVMQAVLFLSIKLSLFESFMTNYGVGLVCASITWLLLNLCYILREKMQTPLSDFLGSILFLFRALAKCSAMVMSIYADKDASGAFATVGFARSGNVFLNRSLRLGREDLFIKQTHHSAGMAAFLVSNSVKVAVIVRDPVDVVVSNKVALPHLSVTALYISYMFSHSTSFPNEHCVGEF